MTDSKPTLPNQSERLYLTDGGLETWLIFQQGIELNEFAAFELLNSEAGRSTLGEYYDGFIDIATRYQCGFVLDTPTWRANADWGAALGYSNDQIKNINRQSVSLMRDLRAKSSIPHLMPINGVIGPRGDGYQADSIMSIAKAQAYHAAQVYAFASMDIDMVSAITMTNSFEAAGIALAARDENVPCVISFTVETDGCLPTGQSLETAIKEVDATTNNYPAYYMINCAHPDHFSNHIGGHGDWKNRIRGVRANASRLSHAELDACTELDAGDAEELAQLCSGLSASIPKLNVIGGCCGTDHRHVEQMAQLG